MSYCGVITMPIYLFHWVVGSIIALFLKNSSQDIRVFLYYFVSIIVGCLAVKIQKSIKLFKSN